MFKKMLLCVAVALVAGCLDVMPAGPDTSPRLSSVSPDCYAGCQDVDPDPEAPGYFIPGEMYSYSGCTDPDYDADADGLDDYCEVLLAQRFAPAFSFNYGDDVFRDMRWAVRADDGVVTI